MNQISNTLHINVFRSTGIIEEAAVVVRSDEFLHEIAFVIYCKTNLEYHQFRHPKVTFLGFSKRQH
jgi:hypothetical protein